MSVNDSEICQAVQKSGATVQDQVCLSYEDRFLRRKVLKTEAGREVLIDLPQTTSLDHGDVLMLNNGDCIGVQAKSEDLLEVRSSDLAKVAWHIGNRHTPCQFEIDRLLIQRDHVIKDMLVLIGAQVTEVHEPFTPEGGAYGHGRTHGHAH